MTKLQWEKASLRTPDPARMQQTGDILAPDQVIIAIEDLSPQEKSKLLAREIRRERFRAALKSAENKRRRNGRKIAKAKRVAIFSEDEKREARLRAQSEARKRRREELADTDQ